MKHYIGVKMVQAEFERKDGKDGYAVVYEDGYRSWSPKDVFDRAYFLVGEDPTKVNPDMVRGFVRDVSDTKMGEKTTIVQVTLRNGFEMIDSSSCVDPANYTHEIGVSVCNKRIDDKIWNLLGFVLQWARAGVAR